MGTTRVRPPNVRRGNRKHGGPARLRQTHHSALPHACAELDLLLGGLGPTFVLALVVLALGFLSRPFLRFCRSGSFTRFRRRGGLSGFRGRQCSGRDLGLVAQVPEGCLNRLQPFLAPSHKPARALWMSRVRRQANSCPTLSPGRTPVSPPRRLGQALRVPWRWVACALARRNRRRAQARPRPQWWLPCGWFP
jgi:hypothetical protein